MLIYTYFLIFLILILVIIIDFFCYLLTHIVFDLFD